MYCKNCGESVTEGFKFCEYCGAEIENIANVKEENKKEENEKVYTNRTSSKPVRIENTEPLTMGQYLGMMLLLVIPVIGIILLIFWSLSTKTNVNRKNFSRAALIIFILTIVLGMPILTNLIAAMTKY